MTTLFLTLLGAGFLLLGAYGVARHKWGTRG